MGGLFSKPKAPPMDSVVTPPAPPPAPPPPAVMPIADDAEIERARRRKMAQVASRSGRQSTILSDSGGDRLGG